MATETFPILNRWSGEVIFTAEITCSPDALPSSGVRTTTNPSSLPAGDTALADCGQTSAAPFTPGPWTVYNGCNIFASNADGSAEYLAVTGGLSGRDTIDRDAANADLIAAAPDLYNALEALIRLAHNAYDIEAECPEAFAALAKARGRVA